MSAPTCMSMCLSMFVCLCLCLSSCTHTFALMCLDYLHTTNMYHVNFCLHSHRRELQITAMTDVAPGRELPRHAQLPQVSFASCWSRSCGFPIADPDLTAENLRPNPRAKVQQLPQGERKVPTKACSAVLAGSQVSSHCARSSVDCRRSEQKYDRQFRHPA